MILTMNWTAVSLAAALVAGGSACVADGPEAAAGPLRVVTGSYPFSEVVERIGGDAVATVELTPPGSEPHDLELTAADLEALAGAGLVVTVGGGFQPALEDAIRDREGATVDVLETVPADGDPHVWLDPVAMVSIVSAIEEAMVALAPDLAERFMAGADELRAELAELDRRFAERLADCARRTFVTTHAAFGHLAARYDLTEEGITGQSPEAEPDPRRLAELVDLVRRTGITTVFTEPLASPAIAETLASETGARVGVLDPLEGLTDAQRAAGLHYVALMDGNLSALADALGCNG